MSWVRFNYDSTSITAAVSSPPFNKNFITWGPVSHYNPAGVFNTFFPYIRWDRAVNNTNSLALTFAGAGRGVVSGTGAAIPCGVSCINNDEPWRALRGRITTQFILGSGLFEGSNYLGPGHAGIICLANSGNIDTGGGAKAYALIYENISFSRRIRLIQMNDGFSGSIGGSFGSDYTLLAQSPWHIINTNTTYSMALEWEVDLDFLRGVRLRAFVSTGLLLQEPYLVHWDFVWNGPGAHLPIGPVASGGGGLFLVGATGAMKIHFDNTSISTPDLDIPPMTYLAVAPDVTVFTA